MVRGEQVTALLNSTSGFIGSLPAPSGLLNSLLANAVKSLAAPLISTWSCESGHRVWGLTFQAALDPHISALEGLQVDGASSWDIWK